jgi:hypothetical protein
MTGTLNVAIPTPDGFAIKAVGNRIGNWNDFVVYIQNNNPFASASPALRVVGNGGSPRCEVPAGWQG